MKNIANDFRTRLYEIGIPIYMAGAEVGHNPTRLSQMLRGHVPIPTDVAVKLDKMIADRERELAQETG